MRYDEDIQLKLKEGSKDENVRPKHEPNVPDSYVQDLQRDLNALGYAAGKSDGWFGPRSRDAVVRFQQDARGTLRQEQAGALVQGRRFREAAAVYVGEADGIVDHATALEIRRWRAMRWQRPNSVIDYRVEDIRTGLPIHPGKTPRLRRPGDVDRLVLHCTDASPSWGALDCARYDINPNHISATGCPTITYTYFINADGLVQKCLSHDVVSWHVGDWNARSLGVAMAYRATGKSDPPPAAQLEAAAELLARLCQTFNLQPGLNVVGHRELLGTGYWVDGQGRKHLRKECPGLKVDLSELRQVAAQRLQVLKLSAERR
jgi:N-acetyl-anhydromuramyl-L-alanine amidase AmpD